MCPVQQKAVHILRSRLFCAFEDASRTGEYSPYRRRAFPVPNIPSVPQKPVLNTDGFQKTRRVPQEAFLSTARIFGTVGCPFWYRILQMPEKRRALPALNATNARKEVPPLHRVQFGTPRRAKNHSPKLLGTSRKLLNAAKIHNTSGKANHGNCADSVDTIWKSLNSRASCVMR